jgi:hypothetical protein
MDEATKLLWANRFERYSAEQLVILVRRWGAGTPMGGLAASELMRRG